MKRIVVTGMGIMAPRFGPLDRTMEALFNGKSAIQKLPGNFDLLETRIGGLVSDFTLDLLLTLPALNTLNRIGKRALKPSKLALVASYFALLQAGLLDEDGKIQEALQSITAAYIGTGVGSSEAIADIGTILFRLEHASEKERAAIRKEADLRHLATGMNALSDAPASQVSQAFGIKGMIGCLIKACATGAGNIQMGAILIEGGYATIALGGGTESLAPNDVYPFSIFAKNGALSRRNNDPEGASRPFDSGHDGFVPSEGAGVLVLEEFSLAFERGATPLAELIGWGETSDAKGATDPDPSSQAEAIRKALVKAGILPNQVDAFVAHGTSTRSGDESELRAFKLVFGEHSHVPITAPKDRLGHTLGASGAIQAAIGIEMLRTGMIPPTVNLKSPIPEAMGLTIPTSALLTNPKIVVCNSSGFGGQNVCLVLSKWQD